MVVIGDERSPLTELVARLPHFAGWCAADDARPAAVALEAGPPPRRGRLGGRDRRAVRRRSGPIRSTIGPACWTRCARSPAKHPGLRILDCVVDTTVRSRATRAPGQRRRTDDVAIVVDRRSRALRGTVVQRRRPHTESFTPFVARDPPHRGPVGVAAVRLRPRALAARTSPRAHLTGRTVLRPRRADVSDDRHHRPRARRDRRAVAAATRAAAVARRDPARNDSSPRTRPTHVPIGLADDPVRGRHDVVWWQPGPDGSMLFIGTPRAGLDVVVSSLTRRDRRAVRATRSRRLRGRCVEPAVDRAADGCPHHGRRTARATRPCCGDHRSRRPRSVRPTRRRRVALGCPDRSGERAAADRRPHPARPAAA